MTIFVFRLDARQRPHGHYMKTFLFFLFSRTPELPRKFAIFLGEDLLFIFRTPEFSQNLAIFCARRLFFSENTCALCPWSLTSSIPVLVLERVYSWKVGCWSWPRSFCVFLASSLVSSTPPLTKMLMQSHLPSTVKFSIVKKLLLRHNKILQYPSKILLTKQFVVYYNSTLYAYFKLVCYHQAYITV